MTVHPRAAARTGLRPGAVAALAAAGAAVTVVAALAVGDYPIPLGDVLAALAGAPTPGRTGYVVTGLRLPRALGAVAVGACFGLAGALFQRLARNALASPDVIGVNAGAAVAAVVVIVVLDGGPAAIVVGALAGGLGAAAAIYLLAYRSGVTGYRLILVGIGITAMLTAATTYLLTVAEVYTAERAAVWLAGSLAGRSWPHVLPVLGALALLVPVALGLARALRALELGDDLATALGVRAERARAALLLTGVGLAAVATAAAGPIAFVALVAPQIARRLVGGRGLALLPAAACGALLLGAADLLARRLFAPVELPVGVLTAVLGGPVLLVLLARANRVGVAG